MLLVFCFFNINSTIYGQQPNPIGEDNTPIIEDDIGPTLEITKQPVADSLQKVEFEFKWGNNIGIDKVRIKMLKKDVNGKYTIEIGSETTPTSQPTSPNNKRTLFPMSAQPANTKVKIEITTIASDGTVIKSVTSNEVTLP